MEQAVPLEFIREAICDPQQSESCSDFHPGISCNRKAFCQFFLGCKSVTKMYLIVHILPFLVFKRKQLKEQ
jgi:hypothetical protein